MLVLDNADKLRGDASAAAVIDYTIHGLDGSTLKQLSDGQLAAATADIYTASAIVIVKAIILTNTDSAARTVNLFLLPSGGTARRILAKDISLGIGFSLHYDGVKVAILDPTGAVICSYAAHAAAHVDGTDDIRDATNALKGLATAAQITKLEGIAAEAIANVVEDTTPQLGGNLDLNQKSLEFDPSPASDHTWNGEVFTGTAGENLAIFETAYLKSDGKYWKIDASAEATAKSKIVMATAAISADASGIFLSKGYIRDDSTTEWDGTLAAGDVMFLSETGGHLTDVRPETASAIVRVGGYMESSTVLWFDPSKTWIEV